MNKWIAIPVIATLAVGIIVGGYFLLQQNNKLTEAESEIVALEGNVSAQRNINSSLTEELKTVKDPRHFESVTELVGWLDQDDTDTKYKDGSDAQIAFILQVRALRDGYLLPAIPLRVNNTPTWRNMAIIGDGVYWINALDDNTRRRSFNVDPIPSHPLPLD